MTRANAIPIPAGRYLDRVAARLVSNIDWPEDAMDCWEWTGHLSTTGYGRTSVRRTGSADRQRDIETTGDQQRVFAHRLIYALWNGDTDLPLDHACENTRCVSPLHVRPMTVRENTLRSATAPSAVNARATHCKCGHPLYGANLYVEPNGRRRCKACMARRNKEYMERHSVGYGGKGSRKFKRVSNGRTECLNGHPATPANTYWRKNGSAECRECRREKRRQAGSS